MRLFDRAKGRQVRTQIDQPANILAGAGVVVLESLLVMLVLVMAVLAIVEWSIILVSQQGVTAAATEGARVAARSVFDADQQTDTEAAVRVLLAAHGITDTGLIVTIAWPSPGTVEVTVTVPFTSTGIPDLLSSFGFDPFNPVRKISVTSAAWED